MDVLVFSLPVPPNTNQRKKPAVRKRKAATQKGAAGTYYAALRTTNEVKAYQRNVREVVKKRKIRPFEKDVAMRLIWYRARKSGDVVDRWKDLCDALQSQYRIGKDVIETGYGTYRDDSQIAEFKVERLDTDKDHPRVVVMVWPLGDDNNEQREL